MILESIVTTVDRANQVNIAPMGPIVPEDFGREDVDGSVLCLRPFAESTTYRNLISSRCAVVHVTDDVALFAHAALDALSNEACQSMVHLVEGTSFYVLNDCCRWFAIEVESIEDRVLAGTDVVRSEMRCRVVRSGACRPFFGFNRAKHAVIEAAILATRTHLLRSVQIHDQLEQLKPLVDKTGGAAEHDAFTFICREIEDRLAQE